MFSIKLSPTKDDKFTLEEDYTFGIHVIPKGFKTNGADVPLLFTLVIPRYLPSNLPMVAMHDYLCDMELYKIADKVFEEMLRLDGYTFRRRIAVWAVKAYHKIKYGVDAW